MTVAGIIDQYNSERPNKIEDSMKMAWLKKCEEMIIDTIILTHVGAPDEAELAEHINDFDMDTELLVQEPYDDLYIYFLDQRIAMNQNDTRRYNAAATMYNNALLVYQQKYNREHMALTARGYLIRHEVL